MNNYGLFFTRDGTVIRLPVNPEKMPVSRGTNNDEYDVLSIGPIMVPRLPSLKTIEISSFFPGRPFTGVLTAGAFQPPEFYINFFQSAMQDRVPILYTPVRYYENGEPYMTGDTGFQVLVTQFDTEERGGETGDFYYTLGLTEYKDYSPSKVTVQPQKVQTASVQSSAVATTEPSRPLPTGQIVVGSVCVANGKYYASSYQDKPSGTANGINVKVKRIVDKSRACPYLIDRESGGNLGWCSASILQVVS